MRRRAGLALLLCALSCGGDPAVRLYGQNDLQLLTAYAAKELCSCLFVMERDDEFCGAYAKASPNLRTYRIDRARRSVQTQAVLFWGATARVAGDGQGCILE